MIAPDTVPEVHLADCRTLSQSAVELCIDALDAEEQDRLRRFIFARDKRTFAVAHGLLRCVLSSRSSIDPRLWGFGREEFGKPFAVPPLGERWSFNLSHSGAMAAVALSPMPFKIGVDVEEIDGHGACMSAAGAFCLPAELERLASFSEPEAFTEAYLRTWTLKESFLKAVGLGIGDHLLDVECQFSPPGAIPGPGLADDLHVNCWQWVVEGFGVVAVTVVGPEDRPQAPRVRRWETNDFIESLRIERWSDLDPIQNCRRSPRAIQMHASGEYFDAEG